MSIITMTGWLSQYERIVNLRMTSGEISIKTMGDYDRLIGFCRDKWPNRGLIDISVADITQAIHEKSLNAPHSARRLRINLSNLFIEAQRASVVPLGHNPALVSRHPVTSVKTERLSLGEWLLIFRCAKYRAPQYFQNAMLLALVTAQRPSDIVKMHKSDITDDYLHVTQFKTGEKIALPLSLNLHAISTTLREVIDMCATPGFFLQHENGKCVNTWSISRWFKICREECGINADTPPPFREQRSLSERLYRSQGVDTQTLLGHKYQRMTDEYNDLRGKEYRRLSI
ncbi:tyrosine-type recombinase/integrase [Erwinia sp. AnSW2-5]|uniref:tyrosine-type recombinase/integrase n=1 Tax=Erwinia sp. AnSW2-5 TaxID=3367692 RepID=UPI00385954F0